MYCKLFASLYQGTLRGHSHEILVFTNLLATCDREGVVDKHYRAIAEEVGLTVEEVKASILILESPDPESRSHELDGARLVRMDEHREWGWRIVNYLKYRAIREEDDRREQNRISQATYRAKRSADSKQSKPASATVSPSNPMQKQQGEAEGEVRKEEEVAIAPVAINPKKQSLIIKETPTHKNFVNLWSEAFLRVNGSAYLWAGAKDKIAVKSLLDSKMEVGRIISIAEAAWRLPANGKHAFERGHSMQLSSFVSQFNKISSVCSPQTSSPNLRPSFQDLQSQGITK